MNEFVCVQSESSKVTALCTQIKLLLLFNFSNHFKKNLRLLYMNVKTIEYVEVIFKQHNDVCGWSGVKGNFILF